MAQIGDEARIRQALGCDEYDIAAGAADMSQRFRLFLRIERTVDERRIHSDLFEFFSLIFHERNQGRDDNGRARQVEGGQLVTKRFTTARGHHRQRVAPLQYALNNFFLTRP